MQKAVRKKEGRNAEPTAMIIDCQSVKSAEGGEAIGFDGDKKVHGRKRVLLTDTLGFVRLVKVVFADQHDSQVGFQLLYQLHQRPRLLPGVARFLRKADFAGIWRMGQTNIAYQLEIVLKEEGQEGFQVLPKRWVIERTNGLDFSSASISSRL